MRIVLFVISALVIHQVLQYLPIVGGLVRGAPILGLLGAVMLAAALARRLETTLLDRRRAAAEIRDLGAVDTPAQRGKLGAALLARGRAAQALEHLEVARAGDPERLEWTYRFAQAALATGDKPRALEAYEALVAVDEEYAYGSAMLELSGLRLESGDPEAALAAAERAARNHGENPETAYRRGEALRALDCKDDARAAFDEAVHLSRTVPAFQKGDARKWANRARRARI